MYIHVHYSMQLYIRCRFPGTFGNMIGDRYADDYHVCDSCWCLPRSASVVESRFFCNIRLVDFGVVYITLT